MDATNEVVIYKEKDGTVPLLEWLDQLDEKVQIKCLERITRLKQLGHKLRRPYCDYLTEGIWELRLAHKRKQYRILYGFCGKHMVLLSHGIVKEQRVPTKEIDRAVHYKARYQKNPELHTCSIDI